MRNRMLPGGVVECERVYIGRIGRLYDLVLQAERPARMDKPRTSGVAALSPQGYSWSTISSARRDQRQRGSGAPPIQPLLFRLGEE
jgi:hypothetical protein